MGHLGNCRVLKYLHFTDLTGTVNLVEEVANALSPIDPPHVDTVHAAALFDALKKLAETSLNRRSEWKSSSVRFVDLNGKLHRAELYRASVGDVEAYFTCLEDASDQDTVKMVLLSFGPVELDPSRAAGNEAQALVSYQVFWGLSAASRVIALDRLRRYLNRSGWVLVF
tara:strand:+ start:125 stop:631 length:507 start_codon:yes stop_codon:yes gene_type:complete